MDVQIIITGILIGFTAGMFGIGGSLLCTPILKMFFGLPDLIALATPLPTVIPTAISGSINYNKKKLINYNVAKGVIIGGLPLTIFGSILTKIIPGKSLMILTGVLIIFLGIRVLKKSKNNISQKIKQVPIFVLSVITGILAGLLSGLLAIGGGLVMMPIFLLILEMSMQEAAATSLFCIAFLATPGSIVHWGLGNIDWNIVLNLCIGMIPASFLGSKIAINLRSRPLEIAFSIFMITFGCYFIFKQLL